MQKGECKKVSETQVSGDNIRNNDKKDTIHWFKRQQNLHSSTAYGIVDIYNSSNQISLIDSWIFEIISRGGGIIDIEIDSTNRDDFSWNMTWQFPTKTY